MAHTGATSAGRWGGAEAGEGQHMETWTRGALMAGMLGSPGSWHALGLLAQRSGGCPGGGCMCMPFGQSPLGAQAASHNQLPRRQEGGVGELW